MGVRLKRSLLLSLVVWTGCKDDDTPSGSGSSADDAADPSETETSSQVSDAGSDTPGTSSSSAGPSTSDQTPSTSTESSGAPGTSTSATTELGTTSTGNPDDDDDSSADSSEQPFDPVALSDDFEADSLAQWEFYQGDQAHVVIEGGELHVEPVDISLWYNGTTAFHMHRTVERDRFMVTGSVRATRLSDPTLPPETPYRLGGIMVRDPAAERPNYVFVVFGADANDVSVEAKTTVDGVSDFDGPPWPSGSGELRICRVGAEFLMLAREPGGAWQLQDTFRRDDMPARVVVGPVAYANSSPADVRISYGELTFAEIDGVDDCMS